MINIKLPYTVEPELIQDCFCMDYEQRGNGKPQRGTFDIRYAFENLEVGRGVIDIAKNTFEWREFYPVGFEGGNSRERQRFKTAQKLLCHGFAELAFAKTLTNLVQDFDIKPSNTITDNIRTPEWGVMLGSAGLEPGIVTPAGIYVSKAVQAAAEKGFTLELPPNYSAFSKLAKH